jgi:hypothetical protein
VRLAAGGWGRTVRPLCRRSCAGGGIPIRSPAAMVRKGSPVRVRQSALAKPLETAAFLCLGSLTRRRQGLVGRLWPHAGLIYAHMPLYGTAQIRRPSGTVCSPAYMTMPARKLSARVHELARHLVVALDAGHVRPEKAGEQAAVAHVELRRARLRARRFAAAMRAAA